MTRTSQKSVARYGTPIRTSVDADTAAMLMAEARRTKRSVGHVAGVLLAAEVVRLKPAVQDALEAEAVRTKMSIGDLKATLLTYWFEDDYLPWKKEQKNA